MTGSFKFTLENYIVEQSGGRRNQVYPQHLTTTVLVSLDPTFDNIIEPRTLLTV